MRCACAGAARLLSWYRVSCPSLADPLLCWAGAAAEMGTNAHARIAAATPAASTAARSAACKCARACRTTASGSASRSAASCSVTAAATVRGCSQGRWTWAGCAGRAAGAPLANASASTSTPNGRVARRLAWSTAAASKRTSVCLGAAAHRREPSRSAALALLRVRVRTEASAPRARACRIDRTPPASSIEIAAAPRAASSAAAEARDEEHAAPVLGSRRGRAHAFLRRRAGLRRCAAVEVVTLRIRGATEPISAAAIQYEPAQDVQSARLGAQGWLAIERRRSGRPLTVRVPGSCPVTIAPGRQTRTLELRPVIDLGGDPPPLGFDAAFAITARHGCPERGRGRISWRQLEGRAARSAVGDSRRLPADCTHAAPRNRTPRAAPRGHHSVFTAHARSRRSRGELARPWFARGEANADDPCDVARHRRLERRGLAAARAVGRGLSRTERPRRRPRAGAPGRSALAVHSGCAGPLGARAAGRRVAGVASVLARQDAVRLWAQRVPRRDRRGDPRESDESRPGGCASARPSPRPSAACWTATCWVNAAPMTEDSSTSRASSAGPGSTLRAGRISRRRCGASAACAARPATGQVQSRSPTRARRSSAAMSARPVTTHRRSTPTCSSGALRAWRAPTRRTARASPAAPRATPRPASWIASARARHARRRQRPCRPASPAPRATRRTLLIRARACCVGCPRASQRWNRARPSACAATRPSKASCIHRRRAVRSGSALRAYRRATRTRGKWSRPHPPTARCPVVAWAATARAPQRRAASSITPSAPIRAPAPAATTRTNSKRACKHSATCSSAPRHWHSAWPRLARAARPKPDTRTAHPNPAPPSRSPAPASRSLSYSKTRPPPSTTPPFARSLLDDAERQLSQAE